MEGFQQFCTLKDLLLEEEEKTKVIVDMEPSRPYCLPFARWLQSDEYWTVNPAHVKKSKELDDNNQAKTDYRDARVIAQLETDKNMMAN